MSCPKIAIVGRPNVGKSALFNRICRRRIAIVDEAEHITRDRNYADATFLDWSFTLIDTAGIDQTGERQLREQVLLQTQIAIEEADALIFVVDVTVGISLLDRQIARQLLERRKPLNLAVNKVDNAALEAAAAEFYQLGIEPLTAISASHGYQTEALLERALAPFPKEIAESGPPRIGAALLGRPNAGKSTLINAIAGKERAITDISPGTTRDALDIDCEYQSHRLTLIDTAGLKRKHREKELVEKLAAMRAKSALARAQVAVLILDAAAGATTQEKRLASEIDEEGKGCVLFFNKWDRIRQIPMERARSAAKREFPQLAHCPMIFGSALTGRNVDKLLQAVVLTWERHQSRIATGPLNRLIAQIATARPPPALQGKRLRIYYTAQVNTAPPTFALFVNDPRLLSGGWRRYLLNRMREHLDLAGISVRLLIRGKPR